MAAPPPIPRQDLSGGQVASAVVLWLIWSSILFGMFFIPVFAGGGWPAGVDAGFSPINPIFIAASSGWLVSMGIRFLALPLVDHPAAVLPLAIIGMALAEGAMFLGIFAMPKDLVVMRQILIVTGFVGVAAYAPVYATKVRRRI
jgi:hypothetical protein